MSMRRAMYLLVVFLLTVSMLFGCSNAGTESEVGNVTTSETKAAEAESYFSETEYPIVKEPITLTTVTSDNKPLEEMKMFQELSAKTNINISTEAIGGDGYAEKKALILASGDLPDMFFGEGLTNEDIATNVDYFVDMAPLIEKYAPNIQFMFNQDPWTKKLARMAGTNSIYGLTGVRPFRPVSMDTWYINKVWLENVGMDIPKTLDEFEQVLLAFKEKDANGNGDPNDEVPLVCNGPNAQHQSWRNILGSFGGTNPTYAVAQQVRDGKVQFIYAIDSTKEAIKYMHKLYSQGLVYEDLMTALYGAGITELNTTEKCRIGVYVNWADTGLYNDQYVAFPVMEGPTGIREATTAFPGGIRGKQNLFSITTANKYPEATMRWINEVYSEEMTVQTFFGAFGEGIEKTDTGYKTIDPPEGMAADVFKWELAPADGGPVYFYKQLEDKIKAHESYYNKLKDDAVNDPYRQPVEYAFPMVTFTSDVADEIARLNNDIHSFAGTKVAQWVTKGGIDEEWTAYLDQLNDMGLEKYLELYQAAYDVYMKD